MEENKDLCISCKKNPVTWPRVCNDCIDHAAQDELSLRLIEDGVRQFGPVGGGYLEEDFDWCGGECKTCGMLYDGGTRCTYCGDPDPWGDGDAEEMEDGDDC